MTKRPSYMRGNDFGFTALAMHSVREHKLERLPDVGDVVKGFTAGFISTLGAAYQALQGPEPKAENSN